MNAVAERTELTDKLEITEPDCHAENLCATERERLILDHLPQVRMIARKIHARLPGYVSLDDLMSTGTVGLISAVDHFDCSRNIRLRTYAEHKIKGAILDSLRRMDWAPRQQRHHAKKMEAAIAVAEQRLQRAPTEEEIAAELNLTLAAYHRWQFETGGVYLARLESAGSDGAEGRDLLRVVSDDAGNWPSAAFERNELQRVLAAAISRLPDIEKTILSLYYHDELTLRAIGRIVERHESRISQLRAQAILRLRSCMAELWPATGYRSQAA